MKARFTKQHAELLALQQVAQIHEQAYIKGYMKAIEETAAPELLEALIELDKLTFSLNVEVDGLTALALQCCRERVTSAIKKAIGE